MGRISIRANIFELYFQESKAVEMKGIELQIIKIISLPCSHIRLLSVFPNDILEVNRFEDPILNDSKHETHRINEQSSVLL